MCEYLTYHLNITACGAFARNQHLDCECFFPEKAYVTTSQYRILQQFHEYGLMGRLLLIYKEFLSGHRLCMRVGTALSAPVAHEQGLPRGNVRSVRLFAVEIKATALSLPDGVSHSMHDKDLAVRFAVFRMSVAEQRM